MKKYIVINMILVGLLIFNQQSFAQETPTRPDKLYSMSGFGLLSQLVKLLII